MFLYCAVLVGTAMEVQVKSTVSYGKKDFHRGPSEMHIHLLFNVFIWASVVHVPHADVVVELNCRDFPYCNNSNGVDGRGRKKQLSPL